MSRPMRRGILAAAVLCGGAVLALAPSSAQTSSYCGHGAEGIFTMTVYSHRADDDGHSHVYERWSGLTKQPDTARTCNP